MEEFRRATGNPPRSNPYLIYELASNARTGAAAAKVAAIPGEMEAQRAERGREHSDAKAYRDKQVADLARLQPEESLVQRLQELNAQRRQIAEKGLEQKLS